MSPSMPAATSPAPPQVVLVDDTRTFRDRRPHVQVRCGENAVALLRTLAAERIEELWLDHDLLHGTTSVPVVDHLIERARAGNPLQVGVIEVHSARVPEAFDIDRRLRRAGYPSRLCYSHGIWTRFDPGVHREWRPNPVAAACSAEARRVGEGARPTEPEAGVPA